MGSIPRQWCDLTSSPSALVTTPLRWRGELPASCRRIPMAAGWARARQNIRLCANGFLANPREVAKTLAGLPRIAASAAAPQFPSPSARTDADRHLWISFATANTSLGGLPGRSIAIHLGETFPFPDEDTGHGAASHHLATDDAPQQSWAGAPARQRSTPPPPLPRRGVSRPSACTSGATPTLPREWGQEGPRQPPASPLTGLYNVLAALREGRALTAKEKPSTPRAWWACWRAARRARHLCGRPACPPMRAPTTSWPTWCSSTPSAPQKKPRGRVRWLPASKIRKICFKTRLLPQGIKPEADFDSENRYQNKTIQTPQALARPAPPTRCAPWPPCCPLQLPAIEAYASKAVPWEGPAPLLQTLEALGRPGERRIDGVVPAAIRDVQCKPNSMH